MKGLVKVLVFAIIYLVSAFTILVVSFHIQQQQQQTETTTGKIDSSFLSASASDRNGQQSIKAEEEEGSCSNPAPPSSSSTMTSEDKVANEDSKNLQPWLDRWESNRIGFHLKDVNPIVAKFWNSHIITPLATTTAAAPTRETIRCFVPLCGKTIDMVYMIENAPTSLNDGAATTVPVHVYGVDGIRKSLQEFCTEQPQLKIVEDAASLGYERFNGHSISLLKGDFFDFGPSAVDGTQFDAMFDRGSLVAIDPSMRGKYLGVIGNCIAPGGRILLVTLERRSADNPEATKKGPPFSISEAMVREMYGALDWVDTITMISSEDTLVDNPSNQERYSDLDSMWEHAFVIEAKK
eukprot:CAMPEP_0119554230 /NCGR_PEP_ID=MMETSP1352-20130426/6779_1 /TAXON_ID=265584 /ORGANISM="Stauroneis constricta, Strain CCMP1120" /LENGTH=350 /DNA_ID=CAMNT_0007600791 /DNA_START=39 /DNA_END=1091 /DNA_ORIENTATION=-